MASTTKMFFAGMGVMLIVLKPEVGVALVNTAAQGLGTVASAMATAVEKKPVKEVIEVETRTVEESPKSAIIEHRSVPNSELTEEEKMSPQEFDEMFNKTKVRTYKGADYAVRS